MRWKFIGVASAVCGLPFMAAGWLRGGFEHGDYVVMAFTSRPAIVAMFSEDVGWRGAVAFAHDACDVREVLWIHRGTNRWDRLQNAVTHDDWFVPRDELYRAVSAGVPAGSATNETLVVFRREDAGGAPSTERVAALLRSARDSVPSAGFQPLPLGCMGQ